MKKNLFILSILFIFSSCIIQNPKLEDCHVVETTIIDVYEGSSYDIVFQDNGTDYYINHGLELGLNLEDIKASVLNKTVILHLPKLFGGAVNSEHIAQLAMGDSIIFTEFE